MRIKELTNEEFINFTNSFEYNSLYQTPEYASVMINQDFETMILGLVNHDSVIAATIILVEKIFGFKYAYAPRGFLIDYSDSRLLETFTEEIKKYLSKKEIMAVKVNPMIIRSTYNALSEEKIANQESDIILEDLKALGYYHLGYNSFFESLKPRFEAIIDLEKPYADIFINFKRNLRTKIKNSEVSGIKIYKSNDEHLEYLYLQTKNKYARDLDYFKDVYTAFNERDMVDFYYAKLNTIEYLNVIKKEYDEFEQISFEVNEELMNGSKKKDKLISRKLEIDNKLYEAKNDLIGATKMLNEHPDGIILASALIIKNQDSAYLIIDGYDTKYQKLSAKHLLIWKLIEKYSNQGFKYFNLGGMTELGLEDNKYNGLNTFKLGFNPIVNEYIGDFELVTNNALYFMYRNAKPLREILKK